MQQSMPSVQNADPETLVAEQDLGRLISFLRSKIATHIDAQLDCMDLTSAQYIVVVLLARGSVNTLAGLSDHMVYDKGAMSRLLKRRRKRLNKFCTASF